MLTLTAAARNRLLDAIDEQNVDSYGLRVAARYLESEARTEYVMGFDDLRDGDEEIACDELILLVAPASQRALATITIDYVSVDGGQMAFVFTPANASPTGPADSSCQSGGCNKCAPG